MMSVDLNESAETAISRLLELEAKKYKLLSQNGGLNIHGLLARIKNLEEENEQLSSLSDALESSSLDTADSDNGRIVPGHQLIEPNTPKDEEQSKPHPLSASGGTPVTKKQPTIQKASDLPHRPSSVLISRQPPANIHPLARANNYNAGSNEVFQPFMYKQKKRPSVSSVAITNPNVLSVLSQGTGSLLNTSLGDPLISQKWDKDKPFDVRNQDNAQLVRKLSNAINNKHASINFDAIDARLLGLSSLDRAEVTKILAKGNAIVHPEDSRPVEVEPAKIPFSTTGSLFLSTNDMSREVSAENLAEMTKEISEHNIDQSLLNQATFECCSVEADLNYLLALSMNSTLPTYSSSDGVLLGNMTSTMAKLSSIFPSRLPSIVGSSYPEGAVSSIDSVNSFCFPDGVAVEVHSLHAAELLTGPQHDQFHILQFTNQNGDTSYACCLIVTMASPLEEDSLVSKACIEMTLQKIAAQRIKRVMRAFVIYVKKQRWQSGHNAGNNNATAASTRSVFSRGSVTGASGPSIRSSGTEKPPLPDNQSTNKSRSATVTSTSNAQGSRLARKSSVDSEIASEQLELKEKSPSFISKYFGSNTATSPSPGDNSEVAALAVTAEDAVSPEKQIAATPRVSISDPPASAPNPLLTLDATTRAKLEGVALALKKAKDAGLSASNSPPMQMSEALLAKHGLKYCDDESMHYMCPIVEATIASDGENTAIHASRTASTSSLASGISSDAAAPEGKKGYLSSLFGFSGRPKSKDMANKSRPASTDDCSVSTSTSGSVEFPGEGNTPIAVSELNRSKSKYLKPRRPLKQRFSGSTPQYLVFQKAYCVVTTLQQLSLIFKLLLAIADAERQFESMTPIGTPSRRRPSTGSGTVMQTSTLLSTLLSDKDPQSPSKLNTSSNWQVSLRMNFLGQAHKTLQRLYANEENNNTMVSPSNNNKKKRQLPKAKSDPKALLSPNGRSLFTGSPSRVTFEARKADTLCTPGYIDSFVIEDSLPTTQEWTMAVLLSTLTHRNIFQLVNLLLMEKSLVIVGKNVGMVTALAFAVVNLIYPFTWEGVFVPLVPNTARELFGAPVPFILGTTTPPRMEDLSNNTAVLYIQETSSIIENRRQKHDSRNIKPATALRHQVIHYTTWFTRLPEVSADMPLPEYLEREIMTGAAFFSGIAKDMWVRHYSKELRASQKKNNNSLFTHSINNPNMNLNICYLTYMTAKEKSYVHSCLRALHHNNSKYAGDLSDPIAWRRYVKFNNITNEDEFIPNLFMEPMRSVVEFQDAVVQTQLFLGYVDRVRTDYNQLEPYRLFISNWCRFHWIRRKNWRLAAEAKFRSENGRSDDDWYDSYEESSVSEDGEDHWTV